MGVLDPLGISALAASRVKDLSGGQRQRVAIARAMVNDPLIILADEPTGSLDTKSAADISQLLHQLVAQGKTLLLVTHNLVLADSCQRQIKMADGEMVQ